MCRGERKAVFFFFGCRVWFSFEDGAATSSFVGSYCWCCALVGSEAQPTVAVTGAGVHLHVGLTWPPSWGGARGAPCPCDESPPPHVLRVKGFALYTAEPESAMAVGRLA